MLLVPLTKIRLRLIDDYHKAWKFSSMRFLALGGSVQLAIVAAPDKVTQHVPEWIMSGLSTFALVCIVAAGIGRVTTTEHKDDDNEHRHEHLQDSDH